MNAPTNVNTNRAPDDPATMQAMQDMQAWRAFAVRTAVRMACKRAKASSADARVVEMMARTAMDSGASAARAIQVAYKALRSLQDSTT